MITLHPSLAKFSAMAFPMPLAPPVTIAIFCSSVFIAIMSP